MVASVNKSTNSSDVPKLEDRDKFIIFERTIKAHFIRQNLSGIVDGTEEEPDMPDRTDYERLSSYERDRDRYRDQLLDYQNRTRKAFADLLDCLQKTEVYGPFFAKYHPTLDDGTTVTNIDPAALWTDIKAFFKSTDDSVQRSLMNRLDQMQIRDEQIQEFVTSMNDVICLINPPMSDMQKLRQLKRAIQHKDRFKMVVQASIMSPEISYAEFCQRIIQLETSRLCDEAIHSRVKESHAQSVHADNEVSEITAAYSEAHSAQKTTVNKKPGNKQQKSFKSNGNKRGKPKSAYCNGKKLIVCYNCGIPGHKSPECRKPKNPNFHANVAIVSSAVDKSFVMFESSSRFIYDSGASVHMSGERGLFTTFKYLDAAIPVQTAGDLVLYAIAKGSIASLVDVYYVPKLTKNLISIRALTSTGRDIIFRGDQVLILNMNTKDESVIGVSDGKLFHTTPDFQNVLEAAANLAVIDPINNKTELWHQRLGHVNYRMVKKFANHNNVKGMSITDGSDKVDHVCDV
jgi:hypothetical protein